MNQVFQCELGHGLMLRGVIDMPENGKPEAGLVLFPAGLKGRSGPHHLYRDLAQQLSAQGIAVLRIDLSGIGDSDGQLMEGPVFRNWQFVEQGGYVDQANAVVAAFRSQLGISKVFAGGLCGGAVTALLAAENNPDIAGVLSISTAVTISSGPGITRAKPSAEKARHNTQGYIKKLLSPDSWKRMASGKSDYWSIGSSIVGALRYRLSSSVQLELENENKKFMQAFNELEKLNKPHLLIFGDKDNRWYDFHTILIRDLGDRFNGNAYQVVTIPDGSHELFSSSAKQQLLDSTVDWIKKASVK